MISFCFYRVRGKSAQILRRFPFDLRKSSQFCFVPRGTSPWTNHLYESILSGCVPILLSDYFRPAFEHVVPWDRVALRFREREVEEGFRAALDFFDKDDWRKLRKNLLDIRCWFDWFGDDPVCSPFRAIILGLELRHRSVSFKWGWRSSEEVKANGPQTQVSLVSIGVEDR